MRALPEYKTPAHQQHDVHQKCEPFQTAATVMLMMTNLWITGDGGREKGRAGGGWDAWCLRSHKTESALQAFCCMRSRASTGDRKNVSASRMRNHGVFTVKLQASLMSCGQGPAQGSHPRSCRLPPSVCRPA